jgi:hypothetical protein
MSITLHHRARPKASHLKLSFVTKDEQIIKISGITISGMGNALMPVRGLRKAVPGTVHTKCELNAADPFTDVSSLHQE